MFMEVCDMINESSDNARDAMKAIRKRLQNNAGKNYTVVMFTLVLVETCVKNCGRPFHSLVASKDFIQELVKMIGPKNEPPAVVQDKVLGVSNRNYRQLLAPVPDDLLLPACLPFS